MIAIIGRGIGDVFSWDCKYNTYCKILILVSKCSPCAICKEIVTYFRVFSGVSTYDSAGDEITAGNTVGITFERYLILFDSMFNFAIICFSKCQ